MFTSKIIVQQLTPPTDESYNAISAAAESQPVNLDWKAFHHLLSALSGSPDLEALYQGALELAVSITGAESATFFTSIPETSELVVAAIIGDSTSRHLLGLSIPRQEILLQPNQTQNEPIMFGELPVDPRWLRIASPVFAARTANLISMPLIVQEQLLGVIQIYNYTNIHVDFLEVFQERVAIEVERKARLEAAEKSNQRLHGLIDALGQLGGTLDRKQILQTILEQSAALVDAERTSLFISSPGANESSFHLGYQPDAQRKISGFGLNSTHKPSEISGGNRSVITIPLQAGSQSPTKDDNSRRLGGLMVVKPAQSSFSNEDNYLLKTMVEHASNFMQAAEIFEGMEELFFDVIEAMVASIDAKDTYTQGHSKRVSDYSVLIAQELGLDATMVNNIKIGSLLHDVGKIGIPDQILKKEGKLTSDEYTVIKSHPLTGWKILREVRLLEPMLPAIIEHHEKLNGSGYPYGLHSTQISMMGRIVAVADVFDAMSSNRPYRDAVPVPEVLAYLEENAGALFDPDCVAALQNIIYRSTTGEF